jgi:hypothetical protein
VDRWLKDDFVFMALKDPSEQLRGNIIKSLPSLVGKMRGSNSLFYFNQINDVKFLPVKHSLLTLIPHKH